MRPAANVLGNCMSCPVRGSSRLCDVPDQVLREISAQKQQVSYGAGSILYRQGDACKRAFVICRGKVKLTRTSADGSKTILKIAKSGELVGVGELIANTDSVATAEAAEECCVACLSREQLIGIMARHSVAATRVLQFLSAEYVNAFVDLSLLRQTSCASVKLGQFMLRWVETHPHSFGHWVSIPYTHSEIAQMVGASRETVSRVLSSLHKTHVLEIKGKRLRVINLPGLRQAANEERPDPVGNASRQGGQLVSAQ